MARYIDLEELEKRIKENIKPETPEEKALIEWCKDECIRQAYCIPTADVVPRAKHEELQHKYELAVAEREANVKGFTEQINTVRAEAIKEFAVKLKEAPIKLRLPLLGLLTKSEIEDYFNRTLLQVRDAIDNLVAEMTEGK